MFVQRNVSIFLHHVLSRDASQNRLMCDQYESEPRLSRMLSLSAAALDNLVSKHCMRSDMCDRVYSNGLRCCSGDLCNGAKQTAVFVPLLLLAPLAAVTLYI